MISMLRDLPPTYMIWCEWILILVKFKVWMVHLPDGYTEVLGLIHVWNIMTVKWGSFFCRILE